MGRRGQVRLRAEFRHVGVVAERVLALFFRGLDHGGRIGVVGDHVDTLREQRVRRLALAARVEPRVRPDHLDLGLGIDAAHALREGVDALHDFGNGERGDVAGDVGLGHPAGDDAAEVAPLVEARVVDADVLGHLVAGAVLEGDVRELRRDLDRRVHVAERRREHELAPAGREFPDHALGVRAFGHVLHELRRHLGAQRLFHRLAALVVLVGPAGVADGTHVDEADLERFLRGAGPGRGQAQRAAGDESGEKTRHAAGAFHAMFSSVNRNECCVDPGWLR